MVEPLVFDCENAMKRVDGDRELYSELLEMFFQEYPQMIEKLREARNKSDARKIQEYAHSMKSALGNLGAMKAFALAQVIEKNSMQGRLEIIDSNIKTLEDEVEKYKVAVAEFRPAAGA